MELPVFGKKNLKSAPNKQRKKKVLKPIHTHTLSATRRRQCTSHSPYQTTYKSHHNGDRSNTSNENNLIVEYHVEKIQKLENELVEARMKTRDLIRENRVLKTMAKRHENALSVYEGEQAKLPQIIRTYIEDIRTLQSQIHQMKIAYKEMENRYKSQSTEHLVLQNQYKHLLSLSKNKQLSLREKLSDQLEAAQNTIKSQDNEIKNFMKKSELQNKTHIHHINWNIDKVKKLQFEVDRLKDENNGLRSQLEKFRTKNYGARLLCSKAIAKDSISISLRAEKPTIHGQGDENEDSFEKTKSFDSISSTQESLHEKIYDNNRPTENVSTKHTKNKKIKEPRTTLVENKTNYSSKISTHIPPLNHEFANLTIEDKKKLSKSVKEYFEKSNDQTTTLFLAPEISMSRTQKDLLLANLDQVSEDTNSYDNMYYKSNVFKNTSNKKYSSLKFDKTNTECESSSSIDTDPSTDHNL